MITWCLPISTSFSNIICFIVVFSPFYFARLTFSSLTAMKSNNAGFDSGGGFSQWLPRPAYQEQAVQGYFNSVSFFFLIEILSCPFLIPPPLFFFFFCFFPFPQGVKFPNQQYWNSTNRGYPDVAAVGAAVLIMKDGSSLFLFFFFFYFFFSFFPSSHHSPLLLFPSFLLQGPLRSVVPLLLAPSGEVLSPC